MSGISKKTLLTSQGAQKPIFEFVEKTRPERAPLHAVWPSPNPQHFLRKILLIDDDPTFGKIMKRTAEVRGISLTFVSAIDEIAQYAEEKFDMALIDFNLGAVTGVEFSEYLNRYELGALSTFIISQKQQTVSNEWPSNARKFVHKNVGPQMMLDIVCKAYEREQSGREE